LKEEKDDLVRQKKLQLNMAEIQMQLFWENIAVLSDENSSHLKARIKHNLMLPKLPVSGSQ